MFSTGLAWCGVGDGHWDVELSQLVDGRAAISFRSLAIWRPRITDRSDGPPLGRSVTWECARGQYAFPRYHKAASRRHPQQYLSVVTRALDAVARHARMADELTDAGDMAIVDRDLAVSRFNEMLAELGGAKWHGQNPPKSV